MPLEPNVAEIIETVWQTHTKDIEGITSSVMWEPDVVARMDMPLLTMFYLQPESRMAATGVVEDVDHRWEVSIYVGLADYKSAQQKIRDLGQALIANFRDHRSDYDLHPDADIFSRELRRRVPSTPDETETYLRASWELSFTSGESS